MRQKKFTPTYNNTISHEEHHPTKNMDHKEGYRQPTQVIILTATKDISMTCNTTKSQE